MRGIKIVKNIMTQIIIMVVTNLIERGDHQIENITKKRGHIKILELKRKDTDQEIKDKDQRNIDTDKKRIDTEEMTKDTDKNTRDINQKDKYSKQMNNIQDQVISKDKHWGLLVIQFTIMVPRPAWATFTALK